MRHIIGAHGERARTAHDAGAATKRELLPEAVGSFVDRHANAAERRRKSYMKWQEQALTATSGNERWRDQPVIRNSDPDYGIQL